MSSTWTVKVTGTYEVLCWCLRTLTLTVAAASAVLWRFIAGVTWRQYVLSRLWQWRGWWRRSITTTNAALRQHQRYQRTDNKLPTSMQLKRNGCNIKTYTHNSLTDIGFSALTTMVRHQEEHPVCKNWVIRCWSGYLSAARCKWFAYCPADATDTSSSLASLKSRLVTLSGPGLPRFSRKRGCKMGVCL